MRSDVTVVIPTHNRRDLLLDTIRSVRGQEGVDPMIIVVDDGGVDGSGQAVRELGCPRTMVLRNEESAGVSRARNRGLAEADTRWVAFVDDDDLWAPKKLARQLETLESNGDARWSCVGAVHFNRDIRPFVYAAPPAGGDISSLMSRNNHVPGGGSGVLVETSLALDVGEFDPDFSILADWEFYLRLSISSEVAVVSEPLVGYYFHTDSMMHDPARFANELRLMRLKHPQYAGHALRGIEEGLWNVRLAMMAFNLNRRSVAVRCVLRCASDVRQFRSATREIGRMAARRLRRGKYDHESADLSIAPWLEAYDSRAGH